MEQDGGCYCGAVRYRFSGEAGGKLICWCRECQHVSGGGGTFGALVPAASITYTQGTPASFTRSDIAAPVTREFCGNCGTHLISRLPQMPGTVVLKLGTLDDPAAMGQANMVIFAADKMPWHAAPEGVAVFQRTPAQG